MAEASFVHTGDAVDYTPGTALLAGAVVVQNGLVGVLVNDTEANELGAIQVYGVFDFTKSGDTIAAGALVYWDGAADDATTTASGNTLIGRAVEAAAGGDATVRVRLIGA